MAEVIWAEPALADLDPIADYIAPVLLDLHGHFVRYLNQVHPKDFEKRVDAIEKVLESLGVPFASSSSSDSRA